MSNPIIIRRGLRIGDLEAETDEDLLTACFVDNGELDLLRNVERPESVIVGRTGAGKSALLLKFKSTETNARLLDPNDISVKFLEHSDVLQFFESIGAKLDLFYKLLWRHVLTIEFLKLRYGLKNEVDSENVFEKLLSFVTRDSAKREALNYLKQWGGKFWLDTDQQIREITEKLSEDMRGKLASELQGVEISATGARSLSTEKKSEIVHRANAVVNQIQIQKLAHVLDLFEQEVFTDDQRRFFLLIDKLDEDWADTNTRCRFIRALIEEIKVFRRVRNIKVLVALRRDLLDIVFDRTRDAGFQQEKYESYLLGLRWSQASLRQMTEKRVSEVFRRQYTSKSVTFNDIFPPPRKGGGQTSMDYILERTLLRPRDVLQFTNECLINAVDKGKVSWRHVTSAEGTYSQKRLASLSEEWSEVYPALPQTLEILRGLPEAFDRTQISERLDSLALSLTEAPLDPCGQAVISYCNGGPGALSESDVTAEVLNCLFRTGTIGVKMGATDPFLWSDFDNAKLSQSEIKRVSQIRVHRMLHRALGIGSMAVDKHA